LSYTGAGDGPGDGFGVGPGDGFGDGPGDGFGDGPGDGFGDGFGVGDGPPPLDVPPVTANMTPIIPPIKSSKSNQKIGLFHISDFLPFLFLLDFVLEISKAGIFITLIIIIDVIQFIAYSYPR